MKRFLICVGILAAAGGGILVLHRRAPKHADLSEASRKLHDPDWKVRHSAALELAANGKIEAIRTLLTGAREENPTVRLTIHNALSDIRDRQAMAWITTEGLVFPERWTRYYGVLALSRQQGAAAVDKLLPLLADNYWQVQVAILGAIGPYKSEKMIPSLSAIIGRDRHWEVRDEALKMLGSFDRVDSARTILAALPKTGEEPDATTEWAVEEALAEMRSPEVMAFLADQMTSNADPAARLVAISAVGRVRFEDGPYLKALPALKAIAADRNAPLPSRAAAIRSGIGMGSEGVAFGIELLESEEVQVRLEAAAALGLVDVGDKADVLKAKAEKETDWRVKQSLMNAARPREHSAVGAESEWAGR